jgi:hypothetical protein
MAPRESKTRARRRCGPAIRSRRGPLQRGLPGACHAPIGRSEAADHRLEHPRAIWQRWMESGDPRVDAQLLRGVQAMAQRDHRAALSAFDAIVAAAPGFAEGWNKRATVHWLRGDHAASLRDIDRTLALEPRHFRALEGSLAQGA